MSTKKLPAQFFQSSDVVQLAKQLVGYQINTYIDDQLTSGIITETEAYAGQGDKACHAHLGRFTKRTAVMYEPGGLAYIYLCYGIHHLFNIVTNTKGNADAILIRAFEPVNGIDAMQARRNRTNIDKALTSGPGNVSQALGLNKNHNEKSVSSDIIWFEERNTEKVELIETTRIGIDYAEEDAELPWRFYDNNSKFVSVK
jgi:DNA-3-methyladenine glycosylase